MALNPLQQDPVVIVSAVRTPMGGFQGDLKSLTAPQLGSAAIRAAVERAGVAASEVEQVLFGCVLPAGLGQAPARQAALGAGLSNGTLCTTLNKMCGSGMQAAIMAHDLLLAGSADVVVAGGMESMSNAPYLLDKARSGYRMGHGQVIDHMFCDGLEDAYERGRLMGTFAEECASFEGFSREAQDAFAVASLTRAQDAMKDGRFEAEIVPLQVTVGKEQKTVSQDEQPPKAKLDKIPQLKPAFREGGTVTAANSSSISDGAAALTFHLGQFVFHASPHTAQVDRVQAVERLCGLGGQCAGMTGDTRIVEGHVQPAVGSHGVLDHLGHLCLVGYIASNSLDSVSSSDQFAGLALQQSFVDVRQHNARPGVGKSLCSS